jgi:hypothetical protein
MKRKHAEMNVKPLSCYFVPSPERRFLTPARNDNNEENTCVAPAMRTPKCTHASKSSGIRTHHMICSSSSVQYSTYAASTTDHTHLLDSVVDVFHYMCTTFLEPADVLALSRTKRHWNKSTLHKRHTRMWKLMALQLSEVKENDKLQDRLVRYPHNFLSCVALVVNPHCGVCQIPSRASCVYWAYKRRFCYRCLRTSTISEKRLFRETKLNQRIFDFLHSLPSCRGDLYPVKDDNQTHTFWYETFYLKEHVDAALQAHGLGTISELTQQLIAHRKKRKVDIATVKERRRQKRAHVRNAHTQRSLDIISFVVHHPIWKFHSIGKLDTKALSYCIFHHPHINTCRMTNTIQHFREFEKQSVSAHMLEFVRLYRHVVACGQCTATPSIWTTSCTTFCELCPRTRTRTQIAHDVKIR